MQKIDEEIKKINKQIDELLDYHSFYSDEILELDNRLYELRRKQNFLTSEELEELQDLEVKVPELKYKQSQERREKLDELDSKLQEIYNLKFELCEPIRTGNKVCIKQLSDNLCDEYMIIDKETNKKVGTISYRGKHVSAYLGDIGFTIYENYRNRGFATEALNLLSDYLYEKGIKDFWISAYKNNEHSVRIIKKYGGKDISNPNESFILYECPTRIYTLETEKKR